MAEDFRGKDQPQDGMGQNKNPELFHQAMGDQGLAKQAEKPLVADNTAQFSDANLAKVSNSGDQELCKVRKDVGECLDNFGDKSVRLSRGPAADEGKKLYENMMAQWKDHSKDNPYMQAMLKSMTA